MRRLAVLLALGVTFVLGNVTGVLLLGRGDGPVASPAAAAAQPPGQQPIPASVDLTPQEERDIAVFRDVAPSVVYISSLALQRDFFSLNVFEIPRGTGSGFVWDDDGHVVTNFHVISAGTRYTVVLADRTELPARLVGAAPQKDLAVLRVEAPTASLKPIRLGTSADLLVGRRVLAIGNPFGLDQSLTIGVVSALGRELESPGGLPIRDVIQTDAAINPGNSGGPLLDSAGRLVGINTAIYSPTGASAGIGFAVPVDTVRRLVPQLIEHGRPVQPGIGVELVPDHWARRFGVEGVIVHSIQRGSPAARAGLEGIRRGRGGSLVLGDVIVGVDGEPVDSLDDLVLAFEAKGVGATVELALVGQDGERTVRVELVAVE